MSAEDVNERPREQPAPRRAPDAVTAHARAFPTGFNHEDSHRVSHEVHEELNSNAEIAGIAERHGSRMRFGLHDRGDPGVGHLGALRASWFVVRRFRVLLRAFVSVVVTANHRRLFATFQKLWTNQGRDE